MALGLKDNESIGEGLRRIVQSQLEGAIDELTKQQLDRAELIHSLRLHCKQMSAILLLLRAVDKDWYKSERKILRDAAATLGGFRDADSMLGTLISLCKSAKLHHGDSKAALHAQNLLSEFEKQHSDARPASNEQARSLKGFENAMQLSLQRLPDWPVEDIDFKTVKRGLVKTYRRGREAMKLTHQSRTDENLHNWRKLAKHHCYQLQVIPKENQRLSIRCQQLAELTKLLGEDHDLAILGRVLKERTGTADAMHLLLKALEKKRAILQKRSWKLGKRVYAEKPRQLRRLICRTWKQQHRSKLKCP